MTKAVKTTLQVVSWVACAATVVPAFMYLSGSMDLDMMKNAILGATIVWFLSASFWMGKEEKE